MTKALLSGRGEAVGVALAREMLSVYSGANDAARTAFLRTLARDYGPCLSRLDAASRAYLKDRAPESIVELTAAAEPRRQEVIRRLNRAPGGTAALIRMREDVLDRLRDNPDISALDNDFQHLLSSWFNRGFLVLRRIDWSTPANILEKLIKYEAVHSIRSWDDLRNRLEPPDRRCYAFFHPQLADDPLIFVEIALTEEMPNAIAPLLREDRAVLDMALARTATFYSISNCQRGLTGISFGNFLIKQVVEELKRELTQLTSFVTLSPVPGFVRWLAERRALAGPAGSPEAIKLPRERHDEELLAAAAEYFLHAKTKQGRPVDPVARFHLGNGARLERINLNGDLSEKGRAQAHGLMVNYLYDLASIEKNNEAYAELGEIVASNAVRRLLRPRARAPA